MEIRNGRAGLNSVTFESRTHRVTALRKDNNDIVVTKIIIQNGQNILDDYFSKIPFLRAYWFVLKMFMNRFGLLYLLSCIVLSNFYLKLCRAIIL